MSHRSFLLAILLLQAFPVYAIPHLVHTVEEKGAWGLPQKLDDTTTSIKFELDSTWHRVYGTASGVEGKVWLSDSSDPRSVRGEITVPVAMMKTGNFSRDQKMYSSMHQEAFPRIVMKIHGSEGLCLPQVVVPKEPCSFTLLGALTIAEATREFSIPAKITRVDSRYEISGSFPLQWKEFGIRDPSIFIARIDDEVLVKFQLNLTQGQ